jgi:hypothetical protein
MSDTEGHDDHPGARPLRQRRATWPPSTMPTPETAPDGDATSPEPADRSGKASDDEALPDGDELEAVTRLLGFLRDAPPEG